jgi:hypothetical protein
MPQPLDVAALNCCYDRSGSRIRGTDLQHGSRS